MKGRKSINPPALVLKHASQEMKEKFATSAKARNPGTVPRMGGKKSKITADQPRAPKFEKRGKRQKAHGSPKVYQPEPRSGGSNEVVLSCQENTKN